MMPIAWKATAILVAAFCAAGCLQRKSAALRHWVWTAGLAALLILPLFSLVTPSWRPVGQLPVLPTSVAVLAGAGEAPAPRIPWLPILYGAGAALAAARFLIGAARTSWMARHGSPSDLGAEFGARVVFSADAPMPLAWGILRRVIILPAAAATWPEARLRSVLLHEWLHHCRRDLLTQAIAQAACCLYWCHPLAWLALARQRRERELACDDAVLRHGVPAHHYATHLMEVVRAVASTRRDWSDAPAMAETSSLESRVRALLDRHCDRRPVSRRVGLAVAAATLAMVAPLAVLDVHAQTSGGAIAGVVRDPSGGVIPGCQVTAKNLDGTNQEATRTNEAGEYRFAGIPSGHYALEFSARGFSRAKVNADLVTGATARVDSNLEVGQTQEAVTVMGRRSSPLVAPQPARAAERIRVGGMVTPMKLVRQTRPVYAPELQQLGVEGIVMIRAIVSKNGSVLNPKVVNSVDPRLAKAALEAVAQWIYQPALLNGEPIETLTSIDVEFQLEK